MDEHRKSEQLIFGLEAERKWQLAKKIFAGLAIFIITALLIVSLLR